MVKVSALVGPFEAVVTHTHNIPHINKRKKNLEPHSHPISLRLQFQATNENQPSFVNVHATRKNLNDFLTNFTKGKVFDKPFEQTTLDIFNAVNKWIPTFCNKFEFEPTFFCSALELDVTVEKNEIHDSTGTTSYRVEMGN